MSISYTPDQMQPQQPMPQMTQAQMPAQQAQPQQQSGMFNLDVIPDCITMAPEQMKMLRDYYRRRMVPHELIIVKGTLEFRNHIVKPLDGEELEQENARLANVGRLTHDRPGFQIQITNAEVVPQTAGEFTNGERFIMAQMFKRRANEYNPDPKPCWDKYTAAVSRNPWIAMAEDETMTKFVQVYPKAEPTSGTPVMIVLSTYESKQMPGRIDTGINGILICATDEKAVFTGNSNAIARDAARIMQERGILITPRPESDDEVGVFDADSPEAKQMAEQTRPFEGSDAATAVSATQASAPQPEPAQPIYSTPATQPTIPWAPNPGNGGIVQ